MYYRAASHQQHSRRGGRTLSGVQFAPGLGAVEVDKDSMLTRWFQTKQHQGWCELYPHLLELLSTGQKAKAAAGRYRVLAENPKFSDFNTRNHLLAQADACDDMAANCRRVSDYVYAIKDYALGGDFGAEGSSYEDWCRAHGYQTKSTDQIIREAQAQGLSAPPPMRAGLGNPIVVGAVIVSVAALLVFITWTAGQVVARRQELASLDAALEADRDRCTTGDEAACRRAEVVIKAKSEAFETGARGVTDNLKSIAMYGMLAAVGFFALQAFQTAKAPKVEPKQATA